MAIAIIIILLTFGSVLFHLLSPWWFTPIASNWGMIDDTISLTFWVTGFVFVVINLFMAYAVYRYRYKKDARAQYEPENKKLEWWLIGVTTVGVVTMLAPGLFVWAKFVEVPEDAAVFEAVGKQWHWSYRFPGQDGILGTVATKYINNDNPFGMNPDDPNGQDDILIASPEVHLPINKPVKVLLRSTDVLHDFAVAQFRVKMDLVPGLVTYVWFIPTRTGTFDLLCEELCGIAHYTMRGKVVVEEEDAFQTWLASYPTFAQTSESAQVVHNVVAGEQLYAVCSSCHGSQGQGNAELHAPKLAGQGDWYLKRQLKSYKMGARGTHEKDVFGKMMAPMAATLTDNTDINNVVAYINMLPDNAAPTTVAGDVAYGKKKYRTCAACHGAEGQGVQAMNAPALKGMSDWYMVTQLRNFKRGIRGSNPHDMYGSQMVLIGSMLTNDQMINDIVAYINTL